MEHTKADTTRRILAALIDSFIAWIPAMIPVVGALVSIAYMLTRDAIMYEFTKQDDWRNRSIGKKLMGIEVVRLDGSQVDFTAAIRRNIPLSIGNIIAIIPIIGWILGGLIGFIFGIIELILALTDKDGRRLGDRWGNTQVVTSITAESESDLSA